VDFGCGFEFVEEVFDPEDGKIGNGRLCRVVSTSAQRPTDLSEYMNVTHAYSINTIFPSLILKSLLTN
jgi:hypothetical protein